MGGEKTLSSINCERVSESESRWLIPLRAVRPIARKVQPPTPWGGWLGEKLNPTPSPNPRLFRAGRGSTNATRNKSQTLRVLSYEAEMAYFPDGKTATACEQFKVESEGVGARALGQWFQNHDRCELTANRFPVSLEQYSNRLGCER